MGNLVFGNNNGLRFRNFLNDLGIDSERETKFCTAVWAPIHCDIHLSIWSRIRSRYAFMTDFLTGLALDVLFLILFAIAATS